MCIRDRSDVASGESTTNGFELLDLSVSKSFDLYGEEDLTLGIFGTNLLDEIARNHNSYVKNEVPLAGRNIGLRFNFYKGEISLEEVPYPPVDPLVLLEDLFVDGYLAGSLLTNKMEVTTVSMTAEADYVSGMGAAGAAVTGSFDIDRWEILPTLALDYSSVSSQDASFEVTFGGGNSNELSSPGNVKQLCLTFSPDFRTSFDPKPLVCPELQFFRLSSPARSQIAGSRAGDT